MADCEPSSRKRVPMMHHRLSTWRTWLKVSKLSVIFEEINATPGPDDPRGLGSAEFAFTVYRSGASRPSGRGPDVRNRRSNGDRERVGFKISKMSNTRFKRDGRDSLMPRARRPESSGEPSAFRITTGRYLPRSRDVRFDAPLDRRTPSLFTKHSSVWLCHFTPYAVRIVCMVDILHGQFFIDTM